MDSSRKLLTVMQSINYPLADMSAVARNTREVRKLPNYPPRGLSCVGYALDKKVNDFYTSCQDMRDYYKDTTNKLPKPIIMKACHGGRINRNTELLSEPQHWVRQQQPYICPSTYKRNLVESAINKINLGGRFDNFSQTAFKR